jgi:hypothetical protein
MTSSFEELNGEKWAELRTELGEVQARAKGDRRRDDMQAVSRGVTFADWEWRMITALRQEVRRLGGDPDRVRAELPSGN